MPERGEGEDEDAVEEEVGGAAEGDVDVSIKGGEKEDNFGAQSSCSPCSGQCFWGGVRYRT